MSYSQEPKNRSFWQRLVLSDMLAEKNKAHRIAYIAMIATFAVVANFFEIKFVDVQFSLTMVIVSMSILFSYLIWEFFIPLRLKNGQTFGKKIFGIGVMREDGIKVTAPLLFIRTILGKFTIETMVPVLIIIMLFFGTIGITGLLTLGLILLLQIILMIATRTNSTIHDVLAKTVVVDLSSQMIFDSEEALVEYKKKVHAEQAARQTY